MELKRENYLLYLNWAFILSMIGLAYQHFFWDTPYLPFFWSEGIYTSVNDLFNIEKGTVIFGHRAVVVAELASWFCGTVFLIGAVLIWKRPDKALAKFVVQLSGLVFLIFIITDWHSDAFYLPHLFEKSARIATVLLLFFISRGQGIAFKPGAIRLIIKLSVAATFIFHGLFALNIFPIPGLFIDMTILILKMDEQGARMFLGVIGVLDILFSFGLFITKMERVAYSYMIIWGFLTAFARIAAHISLEIPLLQLHRWTFEFLIRTPHFLLPVAGIIMSAQNVKAVDGYNSFRQNTTA